MRMQTTLSSLINNSPMQISCLPLNVQLEYGAGERSGGIHILKLNVFYSVFSAISLYVYKYIGNAGFQSCGKSPVHVCSAWHMNSEHVLWTLEATSPQLIIELIKEASKCLRRIWQWVSVSDFLFQKHFSSSKTYKYMLSLVQRWTSFYLLSHSLLLLKSFLF